MNKISAINVQVDELQNLLLLEKVRFSNALKSNETFENLKILKTKIKELEELLQNHQVAQ